MKQEGIYEIARLQILPESRDAFPDAAAAALGVLTKAPGCHGAQFVSCIEEPDEPLFVIHWESVDAHEEFRASPEFPSYRAHIQDHFSAPPTYRHYAAGPQIG